ncbi:MAG: PGF-pre-PGF domain-containing protein [Nanoarchaeota archaeon]|nr:PGF-pre-PGF domain-containing protein [Nanoarchaeota archaeon]
MKIILFSAIFLFFIGSIFDSSQAITYIIEETPPSGDGTSSGNGGSGAGGAGGSGGGGGGGGGSSGGGSGGGGGSYVPIDSPSIESNTANTFITAQSGSVEFFVNNANIAVSLIRFNLKKSTANAELRVERLSHNLFSVLPPNTYQIFNMSKANILDKDIDNVIVNFKILQSWFVNNSFEEDNIKLYMFSKNVWNEVPTAKLGVEGYDLIYETKADSFGTYAIGVRETQKIPPQIGAAQNTPSSSLAIIKDKIEPKIQDIKTKRPTYLYVFAVSFIAVIILSYMQVKRWRKKKLKQ